MHLARWVVEVPLTGEWCTKSPKGMADSPAVRYGMPSVRAADRYTGYGSGTDVLRCRRPRRWIHGSRLWAFGIDRAVGIAPTGRRCSAAAVVEVRASGGGLPPRQARCTPHRRGPAERSGADDGGDDRPLPPGPLGDASAGLAGAAPPTAPPPTAVGGAASVVQGLHWTRLEGAVTHGHRLGRRGARGVRGGLPRRRHDPPPGRARVGPRCLLVLAVYMAAAGAPPRVATGGGRADSRVGRVVVQWIGRPGGHVGQRARW
mgnify:CR=1 FL=1